jgi:hypothetical protein
MSRDTLRDLLRCPELNAWHAQRFFSAASAGIDGGGVWYRVGCHVYRATADETEDLSRWIAEGARYQ